MGCASYLQRAGHAVTVIDRLDPGRATSFGNGGGIASTFVLPLAMPGLMKRYVKYYFDPEGPVSLRWSHMPAMAPFLWQFWRNCRPDRVKHCTEALAAFMPPAYEAWKPLFEDAGLMPLVRHDGGLWIYKDDAALQHDWRFWQGRKDKGLEFHRLGEDELRQVEPAVSRDFKAAVLEPDWHYVRNPYKIVAGLADLLRQRGGTILKEEVRDFERGPDGRSCRHHRAGAACLRRGRHRLRGVVAQAGAKARQQGAAREPARLSRDAPQCRCRNPPFGGRRCRQDRHHHDGCRRSHRRRVGLSGRRCAARLAPVENGLDLGQAGAARPQ